MEIRQTPASYITKKVNSLSGATVTANKKTAETPPTKRVEMQHSQKTKDTQEENSKEFLENKIENINQFIANKETNLRFQLHDKLNKYYVQIVDSTSNEVIKEIPEKKFLDMYASMAELVGLFVDEKF